MKQIDEVLHTRGESQYVDDMPRPEELLFAAAFSSPVAHARILDVEVSEALTTTGVQAVLTAQDIPGENQVGPIIQDEVLLAEQKVVFVGQPIALVIATSPEVASRAASRVRLELQDLPIITDPKEAFRQGEIIGERRTFELGDVNGVWSECDLIVEGTCDIGGQDHVYLETQRARAIPQEDGSIKIHASSQGPYAIQKGVSRVLGLPMHRIEVDVKRIGGGFGGKEDQATHWACFAALGARHTGKPVEMVLSRADDMRMTGKRHPYVSDFRIGLNSDGRILAFEADHYQNSGAAADLSPAVLERTLFHSTNSYFIPNVRVSAVCCRTNLPPNTAFRGFGGPQGLFVIDSAIA